MKYKTVKRQRIMFVKTSFQNFISENKLSKHAAEQRSEKLSQRTTTARSRQLVLRESIYLYINKR